MQTQHRSIKLTSRGVKKIKDKIEQQKRENDIRGASELARVVSPNTKDNLLKSKPVLVSKVESVFKCLNLTLEDTDCEPVGSSPVYPSTGRLKSSPSLPVPECMKEIAKAERVCFLSTWLINKESLAQILVGNAIKRSGETRILILDPRSLHVTCRGIDLNTGRMAELEDSDEIKALEKNAKAKVRADILNSLREISDLAPLRQSEGRLEVRVYDSTPTMTLIIADGYVCQGFHWRDHQGSSKPHIEFTDEYEPLLYKAVMDHFNAIWNSKTTYRYDIATREIIRSATLSETLRTAKEP